MKLKEFFSTRNKWTKNAYARNQEGKPVPLSNSNAVKFCILGGIKVCYPLEQQEKIAAKIRDYIDPNGHTSIVEWQDVPKRRFKEVKKLLKDLDI